MNDIVLALFLACIQAATTDTVTDAEIAAEVYSCGEFAGLNDNVIKEYLP